MKRLILYITIQILAICSICAQHSTFEVADKKYGAGIAAYNAKKYSEAIILFGECDSINKTSNRQMPYFSCNASQWAASCYHKLGDDATAKSISIAYKFEPIDQRLTVKSDSLGYLASLALQKQDYALASQYAKEAMEIESKILGSDHYSTVNSEYISTLEDIVHEKYNAVIPHLEHFVSVNSKIDKYYPDLIAIYKQLITSYDLTNNIEKGMSLYRYLCKTYNQDSTFFDAFKPELSALLNTKAESDLKENNLNTAAEYAEKSRQYSLNDNNGVNIHHNLSLFTLINTYKQLNDYDLAIKYTKEQCELAGKLDNREEYNSCLEGLAQLYYDNGDYPNSYDTFNLLLSKLDVNTDDGFDQAINILNAMGWNARNVGDYDTAEEFQLRALKLHEDSNRKRRESYIDTQRQLGYTYFGQKEYNKAADMFKDAMNTAKMILDANSYKYALLLSDYSKAYEQVTHNYKEGVKLSKKALSIMDNDTLCDTQAYITVLENIASSYGWLNNLDSSYCYYVKGINRRIRQGWQPSAENLFNLMSTSFCCQKEQETIDWEKKWYAAFEREVNTAMTSFHKDQRYTYWNQISMFSWFPVLIASTFTNDNTSSIAYNSVLKFKGLLLNSEKSLDEFIKEKGTEELITAYNAYLRKKQTLSEDEQYKIEGDIINKAKETGFRTDFLKTDWKDIKKQLKLNDIAIEFLCSDAIDEKPVTAAVCISKDFEYPKVKYINVTKEQLRDSFDLYVWRPIIEELNIPEGANIYFSPDGVLCQLGIEYLPTPDGRLMSEKYNMYRVSSTRVLCDKQKKDSLNSAVLYGGLRYNTDLAQMEKAASAYTASTTRGGDDIEKFLTSSTGDKRFGLSYLYETLSEVDSIESILDKAHANVTKYTDNMGNEESFKALSGKSPNLLHIATHGFYFNKTIEEIESQNRNVQNMMHPAMLDKKKENVIDYSMERTGLVFSGAANRFNGNIPSNIDDGLLTAKEIAQLDLSNTDLVVLSACDTGGGDITNDGVAGLQRGFKNAGVNSILMSLWKVDDEATRMLMVAFYRNLMSGHSKMESLRNAQRYVRTYTQDGEHIFSDPKYWASFILLDGLD